MTTKNTININHVSEKIAENFLQPSIEGNTDGNDDGIMVNYDNAKKI